MASSSAADRVKDLFSSFISNFDPTKDDNPTNESSSGNSTLDKARKLIKSTSPMETKCTSAARNKILYYDRVETYSALTWFAKPHDLSPLVCARYGWENVDSDMLQCVNCRAFLGGQLPKVVDTAGYKESCKKLKKNLIDSHEKPCTWSTNPCPELFSRVPYHNHGELLGDFHHRLVSLHGTQASLPSLTYTSLIEQNLTMDKIQISVEEILKRNAPPDLDDVQADVVVFAVCGWAYSEGQIDILQCSCCRRKVGLWNYTVTDRGSGEHQTQSSSQADEGSSDHREGGGTRKRSSGENSEEEEDEGPARKRTKIEKQSFNPVAEHRYWCPWIQLSSLSLVSGGQSRLTTPDSSPAKLATPTGSPVTMTTAGAVEAGSRVPAWLLAMRILSHEGDQQMDDFCSHMKQSPQVEGLRHLRKVLRECTSPSPTKSPGAAVQKETLA